MKKALVDPRNDRIVQFGLEFPVASPLKWVDVPNAAKVEDFWSNEQGYRKRPPPPVVPSIPRSQSDPIARALIAKGLLTAAEIDAG